MDNRRLKNVALFDKSLLIRFVGSGFDINNIRSILLVSPVIGDIHGGIKAADFGPLITK